MTAHGISRGVQDNGTGHRVARRAAVLSAVLLALLGLTGCGFSEGSSSRATADSARAPKAQARPAVPNDSLSAEQVATVQSLLAKKGYEPGPVDGRVGPNTARAIARYQHDNGLKVDGLATVGLLWHIEGQPEAAPEVVAVEAAVPDGLYPVGTRFVYSGVEVHKVDRIAGGKVYWETSLGDHYVTGPDFGLPELEWQTGTWKGVSESTLPPETSWPPGKGMDVYFDVTSREWNEAEGASAKRYVSDASWQCSNEGTRQVKVPAGEFIAQIIACERSPAPAGAWQKRVWDYVPTVGHFVRRHDFDGAGLELAKLDLVAILPGGGSKTMRKAREGAVNDALERLEPGENMVWRNPVGTESYVIRVGGRFNGPGGAACRTYSVSKQGSVPRRDYPAVACRDSRKHRWAVPGLE
jgi:peptidoglycan hydrolase-like protein with peptidoglycan-binding domain